MKAIPAATALGAIAAIACGELHAANSYSYDPDDVKTYIVTVPADETNTLDSVAIGILTGGTVTNFVKRGDGTLSVSEDLGAFVGNVHIDEGVYLSRPTVGANTTLGARSGDVVVSSGATLALSTSVQDTSLTGKTVFLEGDGFGGQGALVNAAGNAMQAGAAFGKSINMRGDGKIATYASQWFYLIVQDGLLELNGYTLTTYGANYPIVIERPARYSGTRGAIVATGYGLEYSGDVGYNYFAPDVIVVEDAWMVFNSLGGYYQSPLTLSAGVKIRLFGSRALTTEYNILYDTYQGTVALNDPIRNQLELLGSRIAFPRVVSGGGLFAIGNGTALGGELRLSNTDNSFSNGLVAVGGTAVYLGGYSALPNKGPLVLTNSSVIAYGSHATGATWTLPQLFVHGTGLVANATGTWRNSVTKTGDGELVYNSWINSSTLNLYGGKFTFPAEEYPGIAPPGNTDRIPKFNTVNALPGTTLDLNGHSYTNNTFNGVTSILNCPEFAVKTAWSFSASDAIAGGGMSTTGKFRFISGATVAVSDLPGKVGSQGMSTTVLSAVGGVFGFPGCTLGDKWRLSLSADGKSLVLNYPPKGTVIHYR